MPHNLSFGLHTTAYAKLVQATIPTIGIWKLSHTATMLVNLFRFWSLHTLAKLAHFLTLTRLGRIGVLTLLQVFLFTRQWCINLCPGTFQSRYIFLLCKAAIHQVTLWCYAIVRL